MDIFFSSLDRTEIYQLPVLPENMPELTKAAKNEEFESYEDGTYNLIGNAGPISFSIDCWMPEYPKKYSWAKSQVNPYSILNMWSEAMKNKVPVRCIMSRGQNKLNISTEIINTLVTVENMNWYPKRNKDIKYKADFKEFRDYAGIEQSLQEAGLKNQAIIA